MSNLVTLCRFHHRKVHEGAVVVQLLDDGAIRFVQPNGESFDSARPSGEWRQLSAVLEQAGIHIDAKTAATRWDGGPMDYGMAIDDLMSLRRDVSAETSSQRGDGVAMLSSVLKSSRAIAVNIEIMRAFVRMRVLLASNTELARKLSEVERRVESHDSAIVGILKTIHDLMNVPMTRAIGFVQLEEKKR